MLGICLGGGEMVLDLCVQNHCSLFGLPFHGKLVGSGLLLDIRSMWKRLYPGLVHTSVIEAG